MGGNRPRNHTPAKYVTVLDRRNGVINFYALDCHGSLIQINGMPKLEYSFRFSYPSQQNFSEQIVSVSNEEPVTMSSAQESPSMTQSEMEFIGYHFYDEFNFEESFKNYDELWWAI